MVERRGLIVNPNVPPPVGGDGPPSPPPPYDDGPGRGGYDVPVPARPAPGVPAVPSPLLIPAATDGVPYLSESEYRTYMDLIMSQLRMLRLVPVARMRHLVAQAEAVGPILDPTAYVRGGGNNLRDQAEMLAAVAEVVAVSERIQARAVGRG